MKKKNQPDEAPVDFDTLIQGAEAEEQNEDPRDAQIRAMQEQLEKLTSLVTAQANPAPEPVKQNPLAELEEGDILLFHVVEDGLLAFGHTWHRGQELEIVVGSEQYQHTFDKEGNSWLSIIDDLPAQYQKWGRQRLALGPFIPRPGEKFTDSLAKEDKRRGRKVSIVTTD